MPLLRRLRLIALSALGAFALAGTAHAADAQGMANTAAREAYNHGDLAAAARLADAAGDRWTAGLTAFRQKRFADAQAAFAALSLDTARAAALRGNAAFWAARSAEAAGSPEAAKPFLQAAARSADGFYALLAKTRLGVEAAASAAGLPTPALSPDGGFTQDKALIYALVKAESRFNASARAGANVGLMQISAATAARLGVKASNLMNAGANLKVGQAYVAKLMESAKGDLIRAVAGYNLGPGAVERATAALGAKADALLLMESLPGENVRGYVRKVLADYWGYRSALKQDTGAMEIAALAPTLGG